jgi:hypothetical protein
MFRALTKTTVHYTNTSTIDEGGWVLGPSRELLFWVPVAYRKCLYKPSNTLVIGKNALELDLSQFAHGPVWQDCYVHDYHNHSYQSIGGN